MKKVKNTMSITCPHCRGVLSAVLSRAWFWQKYHGLRSVSYKCPYCKNRAETNISGTFVLKRVSSSSFRSHHPEQKLFGSEEEHERKKKTNDDPYNLKYWETSKQEACGNCMHLSVPVVGKPICAIPEFLIPDGCSKDVIKSGLQVDPGDHCLLWVRRRDVW